MLFNISTNSKRIRTKLVMTLDRFTKKQVLLSIYKNSLKRSVRVIHLLEKSSRSSNLLCRLLEWGQRVLHPGLQPDHGVRPGAGQLALPAGPATRLLRRPGRLQLRQPAVLRGRSPAGLPTGGPEGAHAKVIAPGLSHISYQSMVTAMKIITGIVTHTDSANWERS